MATLRIDAGRTDKLRPGDIVGALTGEAGLHKDAIGKIDVYATRSYVAIARKQAEQALARLRAGKIKGRKVRVNALRARPINCRPHRRCWNQSLPNATGWRASPPTTEERMSDWEGKRVTGAGKNG